MRTFIFDPIFVFALVVGASMMTLTDSVNAGGLNVIPEPFGLLEDQDVAFCNKVLSRPPGNNCICSAATIETPMFFEEFVRYLHIGAVDAALKQSIDAKLARWATFCGRRIETDGSTP